MQFDFNYNTSLSLSPIQNLGFLFNPRIWSTSHLMHSNSHRLYHRAGKTFIYKSEGCSHYGIYLYFIYLLRYEVIIFKYHLVLRSELLVKRNQTSFFVNTSASSLILLRIYQLNSKGSPSCSLLLVKVYWLDDAKTCLECYWV